MAKVTNLVIKKQSGTSNTLYASWSFTPPKANTLDYYKVAWYYETGQGVWFDGGEGQPTSRSFTFNPPDNARSVRVRVTPVSKTYSKNNKQVSHWTGAPLDKNYYISTSSPEKPPVPAVTIDKYKLTATLENITDSNTDRILFLVSYDSYGRDVPFTKGEVNVVNRRAVFTCNITAGRDYRVCCRAINMQGTSKIYSEELSDFTSLLSTIPTNVQNLKVAANSKDSVKLTWDAVSSATGYTVEYANNKAYFDTSSQVSSTTVTSATAIITGLDTKYEWFFRVRATNNAGESGWSKIVSIIIGEPPEAPTTWSLSTTAVVGDDVILYWVHNSEDGSRQTKAQIQLDINGSVSTVTVIAPEVEDEDDEEPISSYTLNTSKYGDGAKINWKVRTMGILNEYGDWSAERTIDLFAPPTLEMIMSTTTEDTLETLPLKVTATAGPNTQSAISYHLSITANESYTTTNNVGNEMLIIKGSEVYSKIFNTSRNNFEVSLSAGDITLESGRSYTVKLLVSMDSGLTAEEVREFVVDWADEEYAVDASITVDMDTLSCYICPVAYTLFGTITKDVTLGVYRREYDGSFTEIATDLPNDQVTTVTDPHPSLDFARYRIVAREISTGKISYEDLPGQPIGEPSIVIQWDEKWVEFDYAENASPETNPWVGSMVRLKGNVDISEDKNPDTSMVKYIGRSHPVGYYGTQKGETASWSAVIPSYDKDTLYALRRLANWQGDVYVREPSGIGYWANITVAISIKHTAVTIPVSFKITRVEGGI